MTDTNTSNTDPNTYQHPTETDNDRATKVQRPGDVADATETSDTSGDQSNTDTSTGTDQQ